MKLLVIINRVQGIFMENNDALIAILQQLAVQNANSQKIIDSIAQIQLENRELSEANARLKAELSQGNDTSINKPDSKINNKDLMVTSGEINKIEPYFTPDPTKISYAIKDMAAPGFPSSPVTQVTVVSKPEKIAEKPATPLNVNPPLIEAMTPAPEKKGIDKIKNMVSSHLVDFGKKHGFKKPNDVSENNLAPKVGIQVRQVSKLLPDMAQAYRKMKEKLVAHALDSGVAIQDYVQGSREKFVQGISLGTDNIKDRFFLVGEKKTINRLKNNFKEALEIVGFQVDDLVYNHKKQDYLSVEKVAHKVESNLIQQFNFRKEANQYMLPALEGVEDEIKAEIVSKMVWPKLMENIEKSLGLSINMKVAKSQNKYFSMVNDFAQKNNITNETVIHSLKNSPQFLSQYKGVDVINENKDNILNTIEKYDILARNNFIVLQSLVKAGSDLKFMVNSLEIEPEKKSNLLGSMDTHRITNDGKKSYNFSTIQQNVTKLLSDKKFIKEIVTSNMQQQAVEPTASVSLPTRFRMK